MLVAAGGSEAATKIGKDKKKEKARKSGTNKAKTQVEGPVAEHHEKSRSDGTEPGPEAGPKSTASGAGGRWVHVGN